MTFHFDIGPIEGDDHFRDFRAEWEVRNNNEAFLGTLREINIPELMIKAGFERESVSQVHAPGPSQDEIMKNGYVAFSAAPGYRGIKSS